MTALDWRTTRDRITETFGHQQPGAQLEYQLAGIFETDPQLLIQEADRVAVKYERGTIHSPWPILHTNLQKRLAARAQADQRKGDDTTERQQAIAAAEAWIRNAGIWLDLDQVMHELFAADELTADLDTLLGVEAQHDQHPGAYLWLPLLRAQIQRTRDHGREPIPDSGGRLTAWDTPELRARMAAIWNEQHGRADAARTAAEERARAWRKGRDMGDAIKWLRADGWMAPDVEQEIARRFPGLDQHATERLATLAHEMAASEAS